MAPTGEDTTSYPLQESLCGGGQCPCPRETECIAANPVHLNTEEQRRTLGDSSTIGCGCCAAANGATSTEGCEVSRNGAVVVDFPTVSVRNFVAVEA